MRGPLYVHEHERAIKHIVFDEWREVITRRTYDPYCDGMPDIFTDYYRHKWAESIAHIPRRPCRPQPGDTAPADNAPVISCVWDDQRNCAMLKLPGSGIPENHQSYVVVVLVDGKPVQLVQQEADLIVYVNPEFRGIGGWESPPGSGRRFRVGTLERVLQ